VNRYGLLILSFFCVSFASAQDFRPVETRNLRSIAVPFLRLEPRADILPNNVREGTVGFTVANDLRIASEGSRLVHEDYEMTRLHLRWRQGLGAGWDATAEAQLLHRGHGGTLDSLLDLYHRAILQTWDHMRDGQPYGRSFVQLPGHATYGAATGLGDTTLSASRQSDRWMSTVSLKLPTGEPSKLLGSGAVDVGVALQWNSHATRRAEWYAMAGIVWQGPSPELPEAKRYVPQQALGVIYRLSATEAVVGQWQSEHSPIQTGVRWSDAHHAVVTLSWQKKLAGGRMLELFFMEDGDWTHYRLQGLANQGPDLTLGVRYSMRF
jgi:hypothetical protein